MDKRLPRARGPAAPAGDGDVIRRRRDAVARALVDTRRRWEDPQTWRDMVNLVLSPVVACVFASATLLGLATVALTMWIIGLGTVVRAGTLRLGAQMAQVDRWRIGRLAGTQIEPPPLPPSDSGVPFRARQQAWVQAPWLWRMLAYQLVRASVVAAVAFGAVVWWWATIVCFVLAGQPAHPVPLLGWQLGPLSLTAGEMAGLVVAGVAGLFLWPSLLRGAAAMDVGLGGWLLGPSRTSQLSSEVDRLGEARALAVESAEAERRRIERDLHDGLQPELVNLALDLGLARSRLRSDPEAARVLVERAHDDAKRAAADLRNLVRGIHPSVLDERGLDAALSGLIASCAVPVSVSIDLGQRPPANAEAIAYFVVAEAVTNVNKHAHAHKAAVRIGYVNGALRVVVEDDGWGGAHLEAAGGLAGLAGRVASVDGTFSLSSPEGGPTRIEAVIPCAP